jgi:NAD(P)-dependent dehydrogenase (short-subunit alcohol dehydrogenase family)
MDTVLNEGEGLAPLREIWASRNPMGRMGDPSELAGTVILLCSAAGKYINGADIVVDGSLRLFSGQSLLTNMLIGGGSVF